VQDNVKDPHEGSGVSISLHNLEKKYKGTQGLAQLLFSNTKVQNLTVSINFLCLLSCRLVSTVTSATLTKESRSKWFRYFVLIKRV